MHFCSIIKTKQDPLKVMSALERRVTELSDDLRIKGNYFSPINKYLLFLTNMFYFDTYFLYGNRL